MTAKKSLAIVMPVYNESACIAKVVEDWIQALNQLGMEFEFFILDDGSTDSTSNELARFQGDKRVKVLRHSNRGHGPTIMAGYLLACECADWVFQTDSDMEMESRHFAGLWNRRENYDAIMAVRSGRRQEASRQIISFISRLSVKILYGSGVVDVNVPYRLMRSDALKPIVACIPPDVFAPNVIISGLLSLAGVRILNLHVPHEGRKTGTVSIASWRLLKGVFRSFYELISVRLNYR